MKSEQRAIPFRWILPVAQLLTCAVILWPVRGDLISSVRRSVVAYRSHGKPVRNVPAYLRDRFPNLPPNFTDYQTLVAIDESIRRDRATTLRLWGPAMLNLPAMLPQLPYSILFNDNDEWTPKGMLFEEWRDLTWPFIGLVLWWVAGRGIEALIAAFRGVVSPALTPVEIAAAVLFALIGGVIFLMPLVGHRSYDDDVPWIVFSLAGAMWLVLGATIIIARVLQWRIRRRAARQAHATPAPA
jgi:hypothetical protein